jgi:hypothetical protein
MTKESWFNSWQGQEIFSSPQHPYWLWGPHSLPSDGFRRFFPWGYSSQKTRLSTHLCLVPKLRTCGTVCPPHAFMAWCSVRNGGNFILIFIIEGKSHIHFHVTFFEQVGKLKCSKNTQHGCIQCTSIQFNSIHFIHGSLYMIWDKSKINT